MWKFLKYFAITIFLCSIAWFFSGMFRFPDAPIQLCGEEKYCGKQGQPHTKQDYESFHFWQKTLFITHPTAILMAILLNVFKKKMK
jgi:hypothetical protein